MRKTGSRRGGTVAKVLRLPLQAAEMGKTPLVHIDFQNGIEIENCGAVLEYSERTLRLRVPGGSVRLEGENLVITGLSRYITEVRGRVRQVSFQEEKT